MRISKLISARNQCKIVSLFCNLFRRSSDRYECIPQEVLYQNTVGFPVNNFVNKVANRLFNPLELHNGSKFLGRQCLQPFLLQQLLQQQQIAKCEFFLSQIIIGISWHAFMSDPVFGLICNQLSSFITTRYWNRSIFDWWDSSNGSSVFIIWGL